MSLERPPFRLEPGASRRDQEQWAGRMLCWLEEQIDQQNIDEVTARSKAGLDWKVWAISLARAEQPEALQQLYPEFADCIASPKREHGQKKFKQRSISAAEWGADFARRIRTVWKLNHGKKRRESGEMSAEDFAVEICKRWFDAPQLTVDDVLAAAKSLGKRKASAGIDNPHQIADLPG